MRPVDVQSDRDAIAALKAITGYKPSNAAFTLDKAVTADQSAAQKQEQEVQAKNAADAARDASVAAEFALRDMVKGIRQQVVAQFGDNSDEAAAVGLTKSSERKRGGGRKPAADDKPS